MITLLKNIFFFSLFIILLTNCNSKENEFTNLSFDENLVENIKTTELLLKKIKPSRKDTYPEYMTEKDSIFLFNTFINFNNKDSIKEGRINPNKQNIYHINNINGLTDDEVIQLKKSIYYLSSNELHYQQYVLYSPNKEGIYLYTYIFEDWMMEEPDRVVYLSVIDDDIPNDKWFNSSFKILKKVNNIYLLNMK